MGDTKVLLASIGLGILACSWIFSVVWLSGLVSSILSVTSQAKHLLVPFKNTAKFFIWPFISLSVAVLLTCVAYVASGNKNVWRYLQYSLLAFLSLLLLLDSISNSRIDHVEAINCISHCTEHIGNMSLVSDLKHSEEGAYCLYLSHDTHTRFLRVRCFAHDPSLVQVFKCDRGVSIFLLVFLSLLIWIISLTTSQLESIPSGGKISPPPPYHSSRYYPL